MDKAIVVAELRRVSDLTKSRSVSRSTFTRHATISSKAVEDAFGCWNEAVVAAGLIPYPQGGVPRDEQRRAERLENPPTAGYGSGRISDDALLEELLRLHALLGRRPSTSQVTAKGQFHSRVYVNRWGSVAKAFAIAEARRDAARNEEL